jgi:two-component system cell cycle response regulator DivK
MTQTILVVEDDELSMKILVDLLQADGYDTLQTFGCEDALISARKYHPDLIIMDIQLPGISGIECTRMLKADVELKDIPVLAVTAFALKGNGENILAAGCDAYISKPISIPYFLEMVENLISGNPGATFEAD